MEESNNLNVDGELKMDTKEKNSTDNPGSSGDSWFKLAMAKYAEYLEKKFNANDIKKMLKSRKNRNWTFDDVKNLETEVETLKKDEDNLNDKARNLYDDCESCFDRSFERYERELQFAENETDGLLRRWGDSIYALAIIRRGEYYCDGAKYLFEEATKKYEMVGDKDDTILRREGNAFYELAAIDMNNSAYEDADRNFDEAVKKYKRLKKNGNIGDYDYRNWGNALFERGLIAWRRYTFQKVNNDASYTNAIVKEVRRLPRYLAIEEPDMDARLLHDGFMEPEVSVSECDLESAYENANGFFKDATEKYFLIDQNQLNEKKYVDVHRSLGEMHLVFGRKKRYDYLTTLEKIEALDKNYAKTDSEAAVLREKFNSQTRDAVREFEEAVKSFEQAEKQSSEEEKKDLWVYLGVTYYRLYLTYLAMGNEKIYSAIESKTVAKDYFNKTTLKILEILVDISLDISYAVVNDDILFSLLDDESNDDAKFFKNIMNYRKDGSKRLSKKDRDNYKALYIRSMYIISRLEVDNEFENVVAHYANKSVSRKMLFESANFRLNSDYYFNDTQEGKLLLDYLFDNNLGGKTTDDMLEERESGYVTFAGCFSFNYDSLIQFRLYGKENKSEGTGLSLVFNKTFFSSHLGQDKAASLVEFEMEFRGLLGNENWMVFKERLESHAGADQGRSTLFRCVYFDPKTNRVDTIGQKERYLFYREKGNNNNVRKEHKNYKDFIYNIVRDVNYELAVLRQLVKTRSLDQSIISLLTLKLRYLIKHVAFKVEQECRIVKNCRIAAKDKEKDISAGSKEDVAGGDLRLHVKYDLNVAQHVKEIYFGPEAIGRRMFRDYLIHKGLKHIICKKSQNPFVGDSTKEFRTEKE